MSHYVSKTNDFYMILAESGFIGQAPGLLVTEKLPESERRRSSVVSQGKRGSVVAQALQTLSGRSARNPNKDNDDTSSGFSEGMNDRLTTKQAQGETFALGGDTRYYKPINTYEGLHRWDPEAEWTDQEEKKVVRQLDYKICSYVCFMFFALQLDRGSISQALSDNMLKDLHMISNQYNYGQTIFYLCFLCAELPSQMISKKLGPDNWIPVQMVAWSIVAACQSRLTGASTFYLTRALLGLCEGGFIPDVILYLSYFYKSKELPIRLSFFWGAYVCTGIIGAFLAYGILHLREATGWAGWRWLFVLEGSLTALIGISAWYVLNSPTRLVLPPPSPTQTASKFRGKNGWFTEREEIIMVNRILRDDPSKGDMHNRQGLSLALLWEALTDYDLWPIYVLGLTWGLPNTPIQAYLTLILKGLGFSTFHTNLLTIPAYTLLLVQLIFWTWFTLEVLPTNAHPWSRYALSVLLYGFPYVHAIIVAITSRNAGSVRTRTVGSAIYNMAVQASNIIASNIYRTDDAPLYRRGNKVLLGILAFNVVFIISIKAYYMWRNASRERNWRAMTNEERQQYLKTTKDRGNKRLDFRFAH